MTLDTNWRQDLQHISEIVDQYELTEEVAYDKAIKYQTANEEFPMHYDWAWKEHQVDNHLSGGHETWEGIVWETVTSPDNAFNPHLQDPFLDQLAIAGNIRHLHWLKSRCICDQLDFEQGNSDYESMECLIEDHATNAMDNQFNWADVAFVIGRDFEWMQDFERRKMQKYKPHAYKMWQAYSLMWMCEFPKYKELDASGYGLFTPPFDNESSRHLASEFNLPVRWFIRIINGMQKKLVKNALTFHRDKGLERK